MGNYFVMYRRVRHLYYNNNCYTNCYANANESTFTFHKAVWQHYSGEVGNIIIFLCEISSGYCTQKIVEIDPAFTE